MGGCGRILEGVATRVHLDEWKNGEYAKFFGFLTYDVATIVILTKISKVAKGVDPVQDGLSRASPSYPERNLVSYPFDDRAEESVIDGYDVVWTIRYTGRDPGVRRHEADTLFDELARTVSRPALLPSDLALLVAAFQPGAGVHRFPEGTTPDAEDRAAWSRFALEP